MVNFLVGLCVAMVAAVGAYYYWFIFLQKPEQQPEPSGAALQVKVQEKKIPAGAVMEDGTI